MSIERKHIVKSYIILCEGKDAEQFLINYLESNELAQDPRFSNEIQVFDFGGNSGLGDFLMNLKNMDKFDQVSSLAIIRDAEKDYDKACHEICAALAKCGYVCSEQSGMWTTENNGIKVGFMLFPLDNNAGTLEDLCLRILSEDGSKEILSSTDSFLSEMEISYGRAYRRKHKNKLHTYFSTSDKYVTMLIGTASKAGAFDWNSNELNPLKSFLTEGFDIDN